MSVHRSPGISIFLRILIVFMLVNFVTSAILVVVAYLFNSDTIANRTRENVTQQIATIRDTYEKQYGGRLTASVQALTESDALDAYLTAPKAVKMIVASKVERIFVQELKNSPSFHSVRFVDAAGDVRVVIENGVRVAESVNLGTASDAKHTGLTATSLKAFTTVYRQLASTPLLLTSGYMNHFIPPREPTVHGPFAGDDGEIFIVAGIAKLDLESHGFGGVILIQQRLNDFFAYLRDVKFFDVNSVWVFDADGRTLLKPVSDNATFDPRPALSPDFQGAVKLVMRDEGLLAYQDIAVVHGKTFMRIAVSIPSSLLTKDFKGAIKFFSAVMIASLLIVFLVALYVSRYLSRPIVQLSSAASRLATGDLSATVEVKTTGEVQKLVESFNHMTTELRAAIASRDSAMEGLVKEVGERKRVELDLKRQARELIEARAAADRASLAKSRFLSTMSHEIRTPLNGVLGMSELLMHTKLDAEQARYCGTIATAGRSLHELLSDVLDLAKIEEGKVEIEHVDFEPALLLAEIAEIFRDQAASKGTRFATNFDPAAALYLSGDLTRFRQVVSNLLSNALKFTDRGTVELSSRKLDSPEGDLRTWIRVSVRDTGIGIAADALGALFQRFVQADASTTRRFGGSGLGLVISKYLIELMGGTVHVESELGRGSTFWFDLPFDRAATTTPPMRPPIAPRQAIGPAHVLVAEDNLVNQQVVGSLLKHLGATVTLVGNGAQAVDALRHRSFDLVLMDCQMPVLDGFEATAQIRALTGPARDVPIVALTANVLAEDRRMCLDAGMNDYLAKPITGVKLAQMLGRHLNATPASAREPGAGSSLGHREESDSASPGGDRRQEDPSAIVFDRSVLASLPMVADGTRPDFSKKLLDLFESTCSRALADLDAALTSGDPERILHLVHALKSSSAQVGAMEISALARQIENDMLQAKPAQRSWSGRLWDAYHRLLIAVQAEPQPLAN